MLGPYAYRFTAQFSAPADTLSGLYYWTNTYFVHSDFPSPTTGGLANTLRLIALNSVSEGVTLDLTRIESWFGTGTWLSEITTSASGNLIGSDRVLLSDAVRLYAPAPPGRGWYKPLRGLLRSSDIRRGYLVSEIVDWLSSYVVGYLSGLQLVDYRDREVGPIRVDNKVHPWQIRQGTRRASRRVLLPLP